MAAGSCGSNVVRVSPSGASRRSCTYCDVRNAGDALDDDAEQREGEIRVVEACARRQHLLGVAERLEQLRNVGEARLQPRVVLRLALQPRRVREQAAQRRCVRRGVDVLVERVLEVELAGVAQLHDRRGGERLRDRAETVLRVGRRVALRGHVGRADGGLPDALAVAHDGGGDARKPLSSLLRRGRGARARRAASQARARSPTPSAAARPRSRGRCRRRRCRGARRRA